MTPYALLGGQRRGRILQPRWPQRLLARYRGSSALQAAFNVGKGALIGCGIALLFWLMGA